jgi:hypothetical protein
MVTLYKNPQAPWGTRTKKPSKAKGPPTMLKGAFPVTEIKSPGDPQGYIPPWEDWAHIPFKVSELKEILKRFRKLHRRPRSVHPGTQRSQPKLWIELEGCNAIVIPDSHFPGETASTRSGSCSWGQLSLR